MTARSPEFRRRRYRGFREACERDLGGPRAYQGGAKRGCYARAMDDAKKVRDFWFGKVPLAPEQLPRRMDLWFGNSTEEVRRHGRSARRRWHRVRIPPWCV